MRPLVESMTVKDPAARPTMDEVVDCFDRIVPQLSWWTLRSRAVRRKDSPIVNLVKGVQHIFRFASYVASRLPAIPTPSPSLHVGQ